MALIETAKKQQDRIEALERQIKGLKLVTRLQKAQFLGYRQAMMDEMESEEYHSALEAHNRQMFELTFMNDPKDPEERS